MSAVRFDIAALAREAGCTEEQAARATGLLQSADASATTECRPGDAPLVTFVQGFLLRYPHRTSTYLPDRTEHHVWSERP